MKKFILFGLLITALSITVISQNLFQNSDMEEQGAWKVLNLQNEDELIIVTFGASNTVPQGGSGKCLNVYFLGANNADNQVFIYQELNLEGGKTYKFKGLYKDISDMPDSLENTWVECLWIDPQNLPGGNADLSGEHIFSGINTWNGCGANDNGNIVEFMCEGDETSRDEAKEYVYFTIPDSLGSEITLAVGFTVGIWTDTERIFELLFDDFYLADSAGTTSIDLYSNNQKNILNIYPNPVINNVTIKYHLPQSGNVEMYVYNILGEKVYTLINTYKQAGNYKLSFNTDNLHEGIYFINIEMDNLVLATEKILLR